MKILFFLLLLHCNLVYRSTENSALGCTFVPTICFVFMYTVHCTQLINKRRKNILICRFLIRNRAFREISYPLQNFRGEPSGGWIFRLFDVILIWRQAGGEDSNSFWAQCLLALQECCIYSNPIHVSLISHKSCDIPVHLPGRCYWSGITWCEKCRLVRLLKYPSASIKRNIQLHFTPVFSQGQFNLGKKTFLR